MVNAGQDDFCEDVENFGARMASYAGLHVGPDEEDPRLRMTPGGVLEDMFRGLSSKAPNPVAINEV